MEIPQGILMPSTLCQGPDWHHQTGTKNYTPEHLLCWIAFPLATWYVFPWSSEEECLWYHLQNSVWALEFPSASMQWLILAQIRCFHQWPLWSKWFLYCNQWGQLLAMTLAVSAEETLKITRCESWPLYWYCQKREGSHSAGPSPLVNRAWFSNVLWVGKT